MVEKESQGLVYCQTEVQQSVVPWQEHLHPVSAVFSVN